jgi:protein phosphatase 2C family protein 2/3
MNRAVMHAGRLASFNFGVAELQGHRKTMEDTSLAVELSPSSALFAVFDGHAGGTVSSFLKSNYVELLKATPEFYAKDYPNALKKSLLKADQILKSQAEKLGMTGSTACVALVEDSMIHLANVGDSRAILSRKWRSMALTTDHKPRNPLERERIEAAGGFVCTFSGRINRVFHNLSRAVGDFAFKSNSELSAEEQIMSAEADTSSVRIEPDDNFLLIGSDGLWDYRENQEIVLLTRQLLRTETDLSKVTSALVESLMSSQADRGIMHPSAGTDNITAVLVSLAKPVNPA